MVASKQQLINGSAVSGVAEWIQNVEPDSSQLDSIAHISKTPTPSAKIGSTTSPTHNRLGNGAIHLDISDVGTIGGSSKGSQELLDIEKPIEKSTATKNVAMAFTPSDHENNDVFLDNPAESPVKLPADCTRDEKKKSGSEDFSDKKTTKSKQSHWDDFEFH